MKLDQQTIDARIRSEQKRTLENIAAATELPGQAFWLSFAGEEGFRGAVIVHANDFVEAVMRSNLLGVNPHGEVQGMPIPADTASRIPERWKNRLLSREECGQFDAEMTKLQPHADR